MAPDYPFYDGYPEIFFCELTEAVDWEGIL